MRKLMYGAALAVLVLASPVMAEEKEKSPFPHYDGPPQSRQEAIKRAADRIAVLQKMSDADWQKWNDKMQARQESRREAWKNMSPAEREQLRQKFKDSKPASGGEAPKAD